MQPIPKKIYYQDSGYPIERNLLNVPLKNYKPTKKIGLAKIVSHIHYKVLGKNPLLANTHWELFKKSKGLWHFFNTISFGKTPWIVTYETTIPRWFTDNDYLLRSGIKALAGKPCKHLIAVSDCTKNFQCQYLEEQFPAYQSQIASKITVIHPPQPLLVDNYKEKDIPTNKIIFTLIGSDFFRKGGKEILLVFDRLLQEEVPIALNIISNLQYGDYASKATIEDLKTAKNIIDKYSEQINYYNKLPNEQVLSLLKKTHVGLLPTYGDTYGYSVLEAQACGCPVITTNIRALPEINNDRCGWVINVPKDRWGNGVLETKEERTQFSEIIQQRLFQIITDLVAHPQQIRKKGEKSIERIQKNHNPEKMASRLEQIYDDALKS